MVIGLGAQEAKPPYRKTREIGRNSVQECSARATLRVEIPQERMLHLVFHREGPAVKWAKFSQGLPKSGNNFLPKSFKKLKKGLKNLDGLD
jgi:hypothetical protein